MTSLDKPMDENFAERFFIVLFIYFFFNLSIAGPWSLHSKGLVHFSFFFDIVFVVVVSWSTSWVIAPVVSRDHLKGKHISLIGPDLTISLESGGVWSTSKPTESMVQSPLCLSELSGDFYLYTRRKSLVLRFHRKSFQWYKIRPETFSSASKSDIAAYK